MAVVCQICGFRTESHLQSHLVHKHRIKPLDYQKKFPGHTWCSEEFAKKMKEVRRNNARTPKALAAKARTGKGNTGKKRSEEWKKGRSNQYSGQGNPFYGRSHSLGTKRKLSCHFRGMSIEEFDGFTKPRSVRLTKSGAFKTWRRLVFERDDYTCLLCGKRGGPLESHHITPRREDIDRVYQVDNGATLCKSCHKETFKKEHEFVELLTEKVGRRVAA
jgi:hypothetical protein